MKHFKIIDFDAKRVHEFDIKDNEMLIWSIVDLTKDKSHYKIVDAYMDKAATNYDRFHARKYELKWPKSVLIVALKEEKNFLEEW